MKGRCILIGNSDSSSLLFGKSSLLKERPKFWLQNNLKEKKWGSSFGSGSWNGGKHSPGQACPWPVLAVGHPVPAVGTCHWPWGQLVGKSLLLPESYLFLKWGIFPSSFLSAQITPSKFVLACELLVTKMLMTQIQRLVVLIAMMVW